MMLNSSGECEIFIYNEKVLELFFFNLVKLFSNLSIRIKNHIEIEGEDIPNPIEFPGFLTEQIRLQDLTEPFPIQAQTWPLALSGRNLVAISKANSDQTIAYMIPAIIHIEKQPPLEKGEGPMAGRDARQGLGGADSRGVDTDTGEMLHGNWVKF